MLKPKFDGYCCGENCPYDVYGQCCAYNTYRDQDRESGRKIRTQSCVSDHGICECRSCRTQEQEPKPKKWTWKALDRISYLRPGDLIRQKVGSSYGSYIVTDVFGERATAVRTVDVTDPREWELSGNEED